MGLACMRSETARREKTTQRLKQDFHFDEINESGGKEGEDGQGDSDYE